MRNATTWRCIAPCWLLAVLWLPLWVHAQNPGAILGKITVESRLREAVDPGLSFRDRYNKTIVLGDLLDGPPLLVALVWYRCPNLCGLLLDALARDLAASPHVAGRDYRVVAVSIDPRETAEDARTKIRALSGRNDVGQGWYFLTDNRGSTQSLAADLGIGYAYDEDSEQYAHPALVTVLDPGGRISGYLAGVAFPATTLTEAIDRAGDGGVSALARNLLMRCFRYDPVTGAYTWRVMFLLRLAGALTVGVLAVVLLVMLRRDFRGRPA